LYNFFPHPKTMSGPSSDNQAGGPAKKSKDSPNPNTQAASNVNFELQTQAHRGFQNIEKVTAIMGAGENQNNHDNANNNDGSNTDTSRPRFAAASSSSPSKLAPPDPSANPQIPSSSSIPTTSDSKQTNSKPPNLDEGEFDQARELFVQQQMLKMGIDANGMPIDPKLVTFGGKAPMECQLTQNW
jgi:hypothetical protein